MVIIPYKTCNGRLTAQQREVMRHVGRAAQRLLGTRHMCDGHRCLRRYTRDIAIVVLIEHDIAHNKDSALLHIILDKIQ